MILKKRFIPFDVRQFATARHTCPAVHPKEPRNSENKAGDTTPVPIPFRPPSVMQLCQPAKGFSGESIPNM
jgi:hypothetical protein